MHSIISVDFLRDTPNDWVLDEFVALPLQTDSFLCFCPTVWIHPTTGCRSKSMITDNAAATASEQNSSRTTSMDSESRTDSLQNRDIDLKCCSDYSQIKLYLAAGGSCTVRSRTMSCVTTASHACTSLTTVCFQSFSKMEEQIYYLLGGFQPLLRRGVLSKQ